ncbi:MAG: hypothetical protein H0T51_27500, partial [Pirellulales bacterium]|nr:hypothetical protein [Pirellulales bacterium]
MTDALWQLGGWTMVHFLWLGTATALIGAALRIACRRAGPRTRYAVSLLTLAALTALPLAIAAWLSLHSPGILAGRTEMTPPLQPRALPGGSVTAEREPTSTQRPRLQNTQPNVVIDLAHPAALPQPTAPLPSPTPTPPRPLHDLQATGINLRAVVSWLPWLWLVGAPLTFALLASGLVGSERLRRKCTALTDGPAAAACEQLRQAMRITRRVSVAVCDHLAQPVLIGILRPLILLPASALSGWTPA